MKKLLAIALALAMLLGAAACKPAAETPAGDGTTPDAATPIADVPLEHVYTMTDLPFSAEGNSKITVVNDVLYYDTITYDEEYNAVSEIHRAVNGENAESVFKTADGETLAAFTADDAGNLWTATITMTPMSDIPQYTLTKYTPDGELLLAADITDVVSPYGMSFFITDSDGNLYFSGASGMLAYDGATADLSFTLHDHVSGVTRGNDGKIVYISQIETQDPLIPTQYDVVQTLKTLDFAAKTGANAIKLDGYYSTLVPGTGAYAFYTMGGTSVSGVRSADGTEDVIVDFVNSDIDAMTVAGFAAFSDGSIVVSRRDMATYQVVGFSRLTHNPDATLGGKTPITLGVMYANPADIATVLDFNRTSPDVRISIKDYGQYNTSSNPTGGAFQLNIDLLNGTAPDLMLFMGGDASAVQLLRKGALEDLNPFLDADETINREDLYENVLDAGSHDGKLYRLAPTFGATSYYGYTEIFGDRKGISYDDFEPLLAEHPDKELLAYTPASQLLSSLVRTEMSSYADMVALTAHFDTPQFIALLNFTTLLPVDFDMTNFDWDAYLADLMAGENYRRSLLNFAGITYPTAVRDYGEMLGDDVTFFGLPTFDGTPRFGLNAVSELCINAASPNKDAAWSFISYLLSPSRYDPETTYGIPLNSTLFEAALAQAMQPTTDGSIPLTEREAEQTRMIIANAKSEGMGEQTIVNIVLEEAQAFHAGAKSAEETAKVIQSRVGLYLAEQG